MIQHSELLSTSDSDKSATECSKSENSKLPRGLIGMKGLPIAKGTRLPSLRAPRDLTLGGAVKRTFTPNISQCKERSKNDDVITPVTKPEKAGRNKHRTRDHTRRTKTREYIQTQGTVFDGETLCINTKPERRSNKIRSKSVKNPSPKSKQVKAEDQLQKLLCDDFIDDEDEEVTEKLFPTVLPISNRAELQQQYFQNWDKITADQEGNGNLSDSSKENKCLGVNKTSMFGLTPSIVFNMDDLPKSGRMLLFQFPDCLPGIKEKSESTEKTEPVLECSELPQKKKGKLKKKEATTGSSKLADWPEGYLGKLRIHKSGKAYLAVGSLILDINISTSVGFLQELVSLKIKNNTGDMHVLGQVSDKVVCVPSAEALLASCS